MMSLTNSLTITNRVEETNNNVTSNINNSINTNISSNVSSNISSSVEEPAPPEPHLPVIKDMSNFRFVANSVEETNNVTSSINNNVNANINRNVSSNIGSSVEKPAPPEPGVPVRKDMLTFRFVANRVEETNNNVTSSINNININSNVSSNISTSVEEPAPPQPDLPIIKGGKKGSIRTPGKKRKKNENEIMSKSKLRKFLRNTGQEYVTKKGKVVKAKIFEDKDCGCSKKCMTKITTEQRQKCFDKFWKMGDFGKQNAYLSGLVTREAVKQHRPRLNCTNRGPKGVTYQYRINVGRVSKQVCKKYFLQTFLVSDGRLSRALRKEENEKEPGEDLRGKKPPANKTSEEQLNRVRDHINSFPRYDCHYAQNPKGKYLKFDLNVKKMYGLFVEQCTANNIPYVKENIYRSVFNEEFNLTFLSPRKDPCNQSRGDGNRSQNGVPRKKMCKTLNSHMGFEMIRTPVPQSQLSPHLSHPPVQHQKYPVAPQLFCPTDTSKCSYTYRNTGHNLSQDKVNPYNHHCPAILPDQNPFFSQDQGVHAYPSQTPSFFNL